MSSYRYCPETGEAHASISLAHPDWRGCPYCLDALVPSVTKKESIEYVRIKSQITSHNNPHINPQMNVVINLISLKRPTRLRKAYGKSRPYRRPGLACTTSALGTATAPALSTPTHYPSATQQPNTSLGDFAQSVNTAEQERASSIQTMSEPDQALMAWVALDLYLGAYRPSYLDGEEIPKWERLELFKQLGANQMLLDKKYDSYNGLIQGILQQFSLEENLYKKEWELIRGVSKGSGGGIREFGFDRTQVTSLRMLLHKINTTTRKESYTLVFLERVCLPRIQVDTEDLNYKEETCI